MNKIKFLVPGVLALAMAFASLAAHAQTSELVAKAIFKAADQCNMPEGIFSHVHGAGFETGRALVEHSYTRAVGFTGSYLGGRQLFDWANHRSKPIPVFAEMSSINPVFLLPGKLKESATETAKMYASSITLGVGQFCTNPGLIIDIEDDGLKRFIQSLSESITNSPAGAICNSKIRFYFIFVEEVDICETGFVYILVSVIK